MQFHPALLAHEWLGSQRIDVSAVSRRETALWTDPLSLTETDAALHVSTAPGGNRYSDVSTRGERTVARIVPSATASTAWIDTHFPVALRPTRDTISASRALPRKGFFVCIDLCWSCSS